jgi:hypothetical protein
VLPRGPTFDFPNEEELKAEIKNRRAGNKKSGKLNLLSIRRA